MLDLRAEGPSFQGTVKAVDSGGHTIILTIGAKGGVGGEDQEFKVTKQTAVVTEIYHVPCPLLARPRQKAPRASAAPPAPTNNLTEQFSRNAPDVA